MGDIRCAAASILVVLLAVGVGAGVLPGAAWQRVDPSDESTAAKRHENSLAAVGRDLILMGGRGMKPTDTFDTTTRKWRRGATPPFEVHHFQAVTYEDEVWVVGAFTGGFPGDTGVDRVLIYSPADDAWRDGPIIPEDRRRGAAGAVLVDGMIYIAGGATDGHRGGHTAWLDRLDPATGQWTRLADAPRTRDHISIAHIDGKIIMAGGRNSRFGQPGVSGFADTIEETDVYDIATDTWTTLEDAPIPTPRAGAMAAAMDGRVYIIGGESGSQSSAHAETEVLDVAAERWFVGPDLVQTRHGTSAVVMNNAIWVSGGAGNRGGGPELADVECMASP